MGLAAEGSCTQAPDVRPEEVSVPAMGALHSPGTPPDAVTRSSTPETCAGRPGTVACAQGQAAELASKLLCSTTRLFCVSVFEFWRFTPSTAAIMASPPRPSKEVEKPRQLGLRLPNSSVVERWPATVPTSRGLEADTRSR